jgi:hypothetical protein
MLSYFRNCMKTIAPLICLVCLLLAGSCNNCTECTKYPEPDIKLCKKDFASDDSYNEAYRYTIWLGYDCSRH